MPPSPDDPRVYITQTHVINCANPESLKSLPSPFVLGPFDHLVPTKVPIDLVFVYSKPTNVLLRPRFIPVPRLLQAMAILLDYYPHLTGRLKVDPRNGVRSITNMGTGVNVVEAYSDIPDTQAMNPSLMPPWDADFDNETGIQRGPLLLIQRTQFRCGTVAIGYRISHAVCGPEGCIQLYHDFCHI